MRVRNLHQVPTRISFIVPSGYAAPEDQVITIASGKGFTGTMKLAKKYQAQQNQFVGHLQ